MIVLSFIFNYFIKKPLTLKLLLLGQKAKEISVFGSQHIWMDLKAGQTDLKVNY